jgi:hypothetical protein
MREDRRLAVELRRVSRAEGSSGVYLTVSKTCSEGAEVADALGEGLIFESSAKCRLGARNWHCLHVEIRVNDRVDSCRVALGALCDIIDSNADRETCLNSGSILRQLESRTGQSDVGNQPPPTAPRKFRVFSHYRLRRRRGNRLHAKGGRYRQKFYPTAPPLDVVVPF